MEDWQPISTAPHDNEIEVCVIEGEPHVLSGACRLTAAGWVHAQTGQRLNIRPTHWRKPRESDVLASIGRAFIHGRISSIRPAGGEDMPIEAPLPSRKSLINDE